MNPERLQAARGRLYAVGNRQAEAAAAQDARAARFERIRGRAENGTAPAAVSSWQLFPTPPDVAERMADAADLRPGLRVLEPSAGTGNLIRAIVARGVSFEDLQAVEIAPAVARELQRDFPRLPVTVGDFASVAPHLGTFDRVVMNPPFHRGTDARHILRARELLRPGGLLVALAYDGAAARDRLQPLAESFEPLPPHSFRDAGTSAGVVLLTMRPATGAERCVR